MLKYLVVLACAVATPSFAETPPFMFCMLNGTGPSGWDGNHYEYSFYVDSPQSAREIAVKRNGTAIHHKRAERPTWSIIRGMGVTFVPDATPDWRLSIMPRKGFTAGTAPSPVTLAQGIRLVARGICFYDPYGLKGGNP